MKKNKGGRPDVWTKEVVAKLEYAFSIGCTVTEAALYADIDRTTFYRHCKEGSKLFNRFMALRDRPILKARETVSKSLGEAEHAKWYLKNKRADEFTERSKLAGDSNEPLEFIIKKVDDKTD